MFHERVDPTADKDEKTGAARRPAATDRVLALQRAAGNRAVGRLLARREQEGQRRTYAELPGVGSVDLTSVAFRTPDKREKSKPDAQTKEIDLISLAGDHTDRLARLAAKGATLPRAEIVFMKPADDGSLRTVSYATFHLKDATFTSFRLDDDDGSFGRRREPLEHWSLKARSATFVATSPPDRF